jgi:branched-chain amino acid transport system substrate-binding protein
MFAAALGGPAWADILIGLAGPITGKEAWLGEQFQRGAELAVADINAAGGVLGKKIELIVVDDFCDPEQAVAAARKLVSDGAIFVEGHMCSGASIPASEIYESGGSPDDLAIFEQPCVDRAGPCQRVPRGPS